MILDAMTESVAGPAVQMDEFSNHQRRQSRIPRGDEQALSIAQKQSVYAALITERLNVLQQVGCAQDTKTVFVEGGSNVVQSMALVTLSEFKGANSSEQPGLFG